MAEPDREPSRGLGFRARLTISLIASAITPLAGFGLIVLLVGASFTGSPGDANVARGILIFAIAVVAALAVVLSFALAGELTAPLRAIARAVDRVSAGDLSAPIRVAGDDELARLADSHDRLARDLQRRDRELARILAAIDDVSPRDDVAALVTRTETFAADAFALIDAAVILGDASVLAVEEVVPGVSRPLRAEMRAGGRDIGVLIGRLPATSRWDRADQELFELFASEMAAAIRNAQLFATVEWQNVQLRELDAAKDDFLRGVSHNLQTPLTSIRAHAEQLAAARPDRRLGIIAEQTERLSRMVRQLLTVTRLESGTLRPRTEIVSPATRVRKAWEALGIDDVAFELEDRSAGWLAIADGDQLDQVLWALLDNAVKYGDGSPIRAAVEVDVDVSAIRLTIEDGGPGVAENDRARLFARFARGATAAPDGGSGLGLYVSRELCRAMGGELVLVPSPAGVGTGAMFAVTLPGEPAEEA